MAVKILCHQDSTKLEKLTNKALAYAKGGLCLHSVTAGNGMFVAVLKSAPKPAAKPKPQPAAKSRR